MTTPSTDITLSDLPARYREIAEVIGLIPALELVARWGGRKIYVPTKSRLIGSALHASAPELASLLSLHFGGEHLSVPSLTHLVIRSRNRQIRSDRAKGAPVSYLAAKYALTTRQVLRCLLG